MSCLIRRDDEQEYLFFKSPVKELLLIQWLRSLRDEIKITKRSSKTETINWYQEMLTLNGDEVILINKECNLDVIMLTVKNSVETGSNQAHRI